MASLSLCSNKLNCHVTKALMSSEILLWLFDLLFYRIWVFLVTWGNSFLAVTSFFFFHPGLSFTFCYTYDSEKTSSIFCRLILVASVSALPGYRTVLNNQSKSGARLRGIGYSWVRILTGMALVWDLCVTVRGEHFWLSK